MAAMIIALCGGCRSVSSAVIDYKDVFVTMGDLRQQYSPKAVIEVSQTGLMIFGLIPVSPGTLQQACDLMADEARKVGADAVINLQYQVHKLPFPISFFWWVRGATVKGMAVKVEGR